MSTPRRPPATGPAPTPHGSGSADRPGTAAQRAADVHPHRPPTLSVGDPDPGAGIGRRVLGPARPRPSGRPHHPPPTAHHQEHATGAAPYFI
ncbi:hypothetical protein [Streptomyces sp. LUP30]|uniref:hypothetical protein n=1 Tax=Streptomyces sp. LUP30 TaxID=1890285 RepID=UPI00114CFEB5|nr:hypothetical protein [Streptomyces sp. LUP30]